MPIGVIRLSPRAIVWAIGRSSPVSGSLSRWHAALGEPTSTATEPDGRGLVPHEDVGDLVGDALLTWDGTDRCRSSSARPHVGSDGAASESIPSLGASGPTGPGLLTGSNRASMPRWRRAPCTRTPPGGRASEMDSAYPYCFGFTRSGEQSRLPAAQRGRS
jgi:hypothetical protein